MTPSTTRNRERYELVVQSQVNPSSFRRAFELISIFSSDCTMELQANYLFVVQG